ncbi:hypothetical protein BH20ACT7_BH20ACT7_16380 [soil metagenome]
MPLNKPGLRRALRRRYPWLDHPDLGPAAVEAGECDRCGVEARLTATCGPTAAAYSAEAPLQAGPVFLGRRCAAAVGTDAWCDGHRQEAVEALAWLKSLPSEADDVARLWWVATGEVRLDPAGVWALTTRLGLPAGG